MSAISSKISFRSLLAGLILSATVSTNIFAAPQNADKSFENWLEKYGAWDILEDNYSAAEESPDLVLKRAETAFKLGRYQPSIGILQSTPAFNDKGQEIKRLWLGGQANRALGEPVKAVIWYSQAARLMSADEITAQFAREPDLKPLWFDVLRTLNWGYSVTPESAREARKMIISQAYKQASEVWPKTYFVINSKPSLLKLDSTAPATPDLGNSTLISNEDRILIAQSLASASLGEWAQSNSILSGVSNSIVRTFWKSVDQYLETGNSPESYTDYENSGFVHASAFFKAGVLGPAAASPTLWQLEAPASPAWTMFRKKLLEIGPEEALETIDRETGSLLLSTDLVTALQNYRLAFALLAGDMHKAENVWKKLDNNSLPMSLRIAAGIAFQPPLSKIVNSNDFGNSEHIFMISNLCEAAGVNYFPESKSPFWSPLSGKALNKAINESPMDRLLIFTDLLMTAEKNMDSKIAKRAGFLFPDTELAARSFIYLAEKAARNRDHKLSAFYLKRVDQDKFSPELKLKWLGAAVEYDLAVGNDAKALNAYNEILESGGSLVPEKELKLALMIQQKGELKKAQAILERIWENPKVLDDELKAEILFWIAEGEHAMNDKETALRNYLELAYKYPEQNIWAVTAMYRASMIYEHKGQFETAKRFLKTVIKRADRKAQKEAATARLNAIDSKLAKTGADKETSFPF